MTTMNVSPYVIRGLRTRIQVRGEGPPLLLIGGLWSQVPLWDDVLPYLDGFRAIAYDPPGIGDTEMPPWPYSVRRQADFAARILNAVNVERAHVLGVSLGGAVAQHFARSYPHRVNRLVLVSTSHGVLGLPGRPSALARFLRPTAYTSARGLERNAAAMFGGRIRKDPSLVHRWHFRPPAHLRAYAYRLAGTAGWTSLPWLSHLTPPTLVVHGDDDPIVRLQNARVLARLIPRARLHTVRGGGHLVLLDTADEVIPAITSFLQGRAG